MYIYIFLTSINIRKSRGIIDKYNVKNFAARTHNYIKCICLNLVMKIKYIHLNFEAIIKNMHNHSIIYSLLYVLEYHWNNKLVIII